MIEENELPEGWVQTALGGICSKPQYGWTTKANFKCGVVRLLRTTDISSGLINWDKVPFCTDIPENLADYKLKENDIVISRAGSVGVSYLLSHIPSESVFASYLIRFRPLEGIEPLYMAYYLQTPTYWTSIYEQSSGIALANVNARKLEAFEIPLAPTAEQHRIVAAIEQQFTRLDAGGAALQRARAKLKRYRAAVLKAAVEGKLTETWRAEHPTTEPASLRLERILKERRARWEADLKAKGKDPAKVKYVEPSAPDIENLPELPEGWCWATIEQLASSEPRSIQSGPFGSALLHAEFQKSGILAIGIDNVLDGSFSMGSQHRISPEKHVELMKFTARPLDVLITVMATVGRCCVVPASLETAIITKHVYRISVDQVLAHPSFLMHCLSGGDEVRRQLFGQVQGQTRPGINGEILKRISIPLPTLLEQEQIVAEIEKRLSIISELEVIVAANLKRAERLRQSILREAFAGRVVPQDPTDEPASVLLERIRSERNENSKHNERNNQKNGVNHKSRFSQPSEPVSLDVTHTEQVALWSSNAN